jgi:hypothetical protein
MLIGINSCDKRVGQVSLLGPYVGVTAATFDMLWAAR